jgi:hypothetical protein
MPDTQPRLMCKLTDGHGDDNPTYTGLVKVFRKSD